MEKESTPSVKKPNSDANHYIDLFAKLGLSEDTPMTVLCDRMVPDVDKLVRERLGLPENASEKSVQKALQAEREARSAKLVNRVFTIL